MSVVGYADVVHDAVLAAQMLAVASGLFVGLVGLLSVLDLSPTPALAAVIIGVQLTLAALDRTLRVVKG